MELTLLPLRSKRNAVVTTGAPRLVQFPPRKFPPSNYGPSDFYYDATIVRIPYTHGTVWKWWAYWGSLVLERTRLGCLTGVFNPARVSAADWISRPSHDRIATSGLGDVHLGFWSLWASPEGFAGYDRQGNLREREPGILLKVHEALVNGQEGKSTEILVVGHSLGGAVSCFAALDLVRKLEDWEKEDVRIFHAMFGAPPVGRSRFSDIFQQPLQPAALAASERRKQE